MRVVPVQQAPAAQPPTQGTDKVAMAIAAFNKNSQPLPVPDANNISVEELGALNVPQEPEEVNNSTELEASAEVPAEEPAKQEPDPALSRQFAQLARQEKAIRAQVQAMKAREAALVAREQALAPQPKAVEQDLSSYISKDRFKQDPLAVLAEAGLSYDEITQQLINQQPRDPRVEANISRLEAKIKELEQKSEQSTKSYADQQANQYQAAVKQIKMDTTNLVANDANFETIKATNSVQDVVDLITQTYEKDGILLSVEDAAQQVEDYLMEEAMNLYKINKIKDRIATNAKVAVPAQKNQPIDPKQPQPMKTLTNATATTRKLSTRERAIAAAEGRLK